MMQAPRLTQMEAANKYCGGIQNFDLLTQDKKSEIVAAYLAANVNADAYHYVSHEKDKTEVVTAGRK